MANATATKISASIFIVPNAISKMIVEDPSTAEFRNKQIDNDLEKAKRIGLINEGFHKSKHDAMVQVWIHSEEQENWADHCLPEVLWDKDFVSKGRFDLQRGPSHIPESVLKGRQEGDVLVVVTPNGTTVEYTFQQIGYRYERLGRFEECLAKLLRE